MDDGEVVEAFVSGSAVQAFGVGLHIDGDSLVFNGWWTVAFRIAPRTFALRHEAPPEETGVLDDVASELDAHGFQRVPADVSLLVAVTYAAIDLGFVEWTIWSRDLATAQADLGARAGVDTFFGDAPAGDEGRRGAALAAGMGGLRRTAGLAPLVVLSVGIDESAVDVMRGMLGNCHIESRALGEITPEACESLMPNLALVDATSGEGETFIVGLRATAHGRFLPLVALSRTPADVADVTLDPAESPAGWAEHLRSLLP
ncbi:MAG: hypothetical protein M3Y36_05600 [Actinomycetota bacterium]|nr:hypothetical protein [Actinomycetota bacterium]